MGIGLYYRKLLFFSFLGLLLFTYTKLDLPDLYKSLTVSASLESPVNNSYDPSSYYLKIILNEDGSIEYNDQKLKNAIKPRQDYDELRLLILDQPAQMYNYAKIALELPKQITKFPEEPKTIAVHGASPLGASNETGNEIIYEATSVGQTSTVTITAYFPKGYLTLSYLEEANRTFSSVSGIVWFFGGVLFAPIALILFISIYFRSRFHVLPKKVNGEREEPPQKIPPAIASVIFYGKVGPRTIMAILIDLAQRGYINIYNRKDDFVIYKTGQDKNWNLLSSFEKTLLDKVFMPTQKTVGSMDVEARVSRHLFSRKISMMYLDLYRTAQSLGYFDESPARLHLRYRMIGILMFFVGFLGFFIFSFYAPDPKFILFLWLAIVILGVLTINISSSLTGFSQKGERERQEWLKFRNYLNKGELIKGNDELFAKYLTYAVAMGVEAGWAARFSEANFVDPSWYDFVDGVHGVEGFAKSFLPIMDYMGKTLDFSSEPLVR